MTNRARHSGFLLPFALLFGGCGGGGLINVNTTPSSTTTGGTSIASVTTAADLTTAETSAIKLVAQSPAELANAVITAQAIANSSAITVCPATTSGTVIPNTPTAVTASFGAGCAVSTAPEYTCSGTANGTQTHQTTNVVPRGQLTLALQTVSCAANPPVSGTLEVNVATPGAPVTDLNGTWTLTYAQNGDTFTLTGPGDLQYDNSLRNVNIVNFNGQINGPPATRNVTLLNLSLSQATRASSIPFTGQAAVTGADIRELIITFDANSPTTGNVTVNVAGGPPFTVDINTL